MGLFCLVLLKSRDKKIVEHLGGAFRLVVRSPIGKLINYLLICGPIDPDLYLDRSIITSRAQDYLKYICDSLRIE